MYFIEKYQPMKNYILCCYYNKCTFIGYLMAFLGVCLEFLFSIRIEYLMAIYSIAILCLVVTEFGFETYRVFKIVNLWFESHSSLKKILPTEYCQRVGFLLAIKMHNEKKKLT